VEVFDPASTEDSFQLLLISLYIDSGQTSRKTHVTCQECVFIGPLPSNGYMWTTCKTPILLSEYVFTGLLPSTGHGANHIENTSAKIFSIVACAYFGRCLEMGLHVTIYYLYGAHCNTILPHCSDLLKEPVWIRTLCDISHHVTAAFYYAELLTPSTPQPGGRPTDAHVQLHVGHIHSWLPAGAFSSSVYWNCLFQILCSCLLWLIMNLTMNYRKSKSGNSDTVHDLPI
jgi:hypothetical protein